jgi:tetratricopeptide (TPR) repeat protein
MLHCNEKGTGGMKNHPRGGQEPELSERDTSKFSSTGWFVPFPRNRFFTGRESHLRALHEHFQLPGNDMQAQIQIICGVGGIGKTQLALEYTNRFRDDYAVVLWLHMETPETLLADLIALMDVFDLPEKQEREYHQVLSTVKRWLMRQSSWLLILDNVKEFALVRELLPHNCVGHVLLTTRRQVPFTSGSCLRLPSWSPEEGVLFLLNRARLLPRQASLQSVTDELRKQATSIYEELGGLPLALDQAGAYLEETGCTLPGYKQRFLEDPALLLSRRGLEHFAHPDPVTTTILLAVEQVEQQCPAAAELLRFCAFLACDAIPEELVTEQSAEILGPILYASVTDPFSMDTMYATVHAASLIELNVQTRLLTVHRLVQTMIVMSMDKGIQQLWVQRVLLAVYWAFPVIEKDRSSAALSWSARLLPHALFTLASIDRFLPEEQQSALIPEISGLMCKVSSYLVTQGSYQKAQSLLEHSLSLRERTLGATHPFVVDLLARLGYLLRVQGQYAGAQARLERALAIFEESIRKEHDKRAGSAADGASPCLACGLAPQAFGTIPTVPALSLARLKQASPFLTSVLTNMAMISLERGHYQQAENLVKRVISIQERLQESEELSLTDLAIIYRRQGRYGEARALLLHALRLCEQDLGPSQSPNLLVVLSNLASFYMEQGRYVEARSLYLRVLQLNEQTGGLDVPQVAMMLQKLGDLSREQEHFENAESEYLRALDLWEQAAGPGHLLTAYALHGLALLRMAQGQYKEAEYFFRKTIQIREQAYDEVHADLAEVLHDLALFYCKQGKDEAALPLFERAWQIRERVLGPRHPALATSLHNLGLLHARQGRKEQARSYYQRSLALRKQVLGERHPETQQTRSCLKTL